MCILVYSVLLLSSIHFLHIIGIVGGRGELEAADTPICIEIGVRGSIDGQRSPCYTKYGGA
jgi:hypothetical protein